MAHSPNSRAKAGSGDVVRSPQTEPGLPVSIAKACQMKAATAEKKNRTSIPMLGAWSGLMPLSTWVRSGLRPALARKKAIEAKTANPIPNTRVVLPVERLSLVMPPSSQELCEPWVL